jgi:hypothetical protein
VLPRGFVKVRYYGFFAAAHRSRLLSLRQQLGTSPAPISSEETRPETTQAQALPKFLCPHCGQPLHLQRTLPPTLCRSP